MSFLYDYDTHIDKTNAKETARELSNLMKFDNNGYYSTSSEDHVKKVSYPGNSHEALSDMEQAFGKMEGQYASMLNQIQTINNLANMSTYVQNSYEKESERAGSLRNSTINNVYKMRQLYMANKYAISYNNYVIAILQFTIAIAVIGVFIFMGLSGEMYTMPVAMCILGFVFMFYVIILIIAYRGMLNRRKDDWSKLYFGAPTSSSVVVKSKSTIS